MNEKITPSLIVQLLSLCIEPYFPPSLPHFFTSSGSMFTCKKTLSPVRNPTSCRVLWSSRVTGVEIEGTKEEEESNKGRTRVGRGSEPG